MPLDLSRVAPADRTAVLILEMQNGLVGTGPGASPVAAAVAENNTVRQCAALAGAARDAGVRIVHCIKTERADGLGASLNTPMWRRRARVGFDPLVPGSQSAAVVSELGPDPGDIVCSRSRGVTAFGGTELDSILRNLGVSTVVLCGISVNVGIFAGCVDAVSCGYDVVVATDACAGTPADYVEQVLKYSLASLAVLTDVESLASAWRGVS